MVVAPFKPQPPPPVECVEDDDKITTVHSTGIKCTIVFYKHTGISKMVQKKEVVWFYKTPTNVISWDEGSGTWYVWARGQFGDLGDAT